MKDIKECADFYSTLLNKDYIFTLENNLSFKLFFNSQNFLHLLGLEKLTDISPFSRSESAKKIFKLIQKEYITQRDICQSKFYLKRNIDKRINNFQRIADMLNAEKCKVIVDFDSSLVNGTELKNTKYILYQHVNDGYVHLTVGNKSKKLYPETFFFENSKRYVNGQTLLNVEDIQIIQR